MSICHLPVELCDIVKGNIIDDARPPWNSLVLVDRDWRYWINTHRFRKVTLNDGLTYSGKVLLLPDILHHTIWNEHDSVTRHIEHLELELLSGQMRRNGRFRLPPHTRDARVISAFVQVVEILSRRSKEEGAILRVSLRAPLRYSWDPYTPPHRTASSPCFLDLDETLAASLSEICCHSRLSALSISNIENIPLEIFDLINVIELFLSNISTSMPTAPTPLDSISLPNVRKLIIDKMCAGIQDFIKLERGPGMLMPKLTDIKCMSGMFNVFLEAFDLRLQNIHVVHNTGDVYGTIFVPGWPEEMDALRHLHIELHITHEYKLNPHYVPIFQRIITVLPPYLPEVLTIEIVSHGTYIETFDISLLRVIRRRLYDRSLVDILRKHCQLTGGRVHFKVIATYTEDYELGATDEERYRVIEVFVTGFADLHQIPNCVVKVSVLRISSMLSFP